MVELLVAMTMMVIITGATVSLFVSTIKDQSRVTKTADQVGEARTAIRTMVDDIRQGSTITATSPTPTASELKFKTYIHATSCSSSTAVSATAIQCSVTYKCAKEASKTTYQCTRAIEAGAAQKIVGGLSNGSVFVYSPAATPASATYVGVVLTLPGATGTNTTTFEGGAALRDSATNLGY